MSTPDISIILPVYNQADHIESIVKSYIEVLRKIPITFEIDLLVNGNKDNSETVCQNLTEDYPEVRWSTSSPPGWGRAVRNGIAEARGKSICYTNSARTTPQELQLSVLYSVANPDTIIKANRKIRESFVRRLGSLIYNLQCRALFDLSYWDINGTPKIFPRHCSTLLELKSDDDMIDLEFNVVCRKFGYTILELPIFSAVRHGGKSTTNWKSAYKMYWGAANMRRNWISKFHGDGKP